MKEWGAILFFICFTAQPNGYAADADDIDYRRNVMKTLGAQVEALELVLRGHAPSWHLRHHLVALTATSEQIISAFEPTALGGNAHSTTWDDWDAFAALAGEQIERLESLRIGLTNAAPSAVDVRKSLRCVECHNRFRGEFQEKRFQDVDDVALNTINYRQSLMRAMSEQTAALGQILAWVVSDENFVRHLESIAANARLSVEAFEPAVAGGDALPRVWTNGEDFNARMGALVDGISQTAATAQTHGKDAALVPLIDALNCDQCHDRYRR